MKYFHFTGFFLEKYSTMWRHTAACESRLLVPNPNITKSFPKPDVYQFPLREEQKGSYWTSVDWNPSVASQEVFTQSDPSKSYFWRNKNCLFDYTVHSESITRWNGEENQPEVFLFQHLARLWFTVARARLRNSCKWSTLISRLPLSVLTLVTWQDLEEVLGAENRGRFLFFKAVVKIYSKDMWIKFSQEEKSAGRGAAGYVCTMTLCKLPLLYLPNFCLYVS